MNYGYIRVSSDKQTVENQRYEIQRFCQKEGLSIDGWIEETISGICATDERELGHLLETIRKASGPPGGFKKQSAGIGGAAGGDFGMACAGRVRCGHLRTDGCV